MLSVQDKILRDICFCNAQAAHKAEIYPSAEVWYSYALELDPNNEDIIYASIFPLAMQRKLDEAIARCTLAMKSDKFNNEAQYSRGLIRLNAGDYIGGFEDFETRLKLRELKQVNDKFAGKKYWNGEPCKALYVFGEQGFGDILMFSRYVPLIKTKFKVDKIYFEVPQSANDLFTYNFADDKEIEVVSDGTFNETIGNTPAYKISEYYVHLASLVKLFGTTINTVPPIKLKAHPKYIEKYKYLSNKNSVAVCYGGRQAEDWHAKTWNALRNVDANTINTILDGFNIIPIQKEYNNDIETWSDTAGILANCKFTVTVDSGPAHLSAAMGVPTIVLNHYHTCWRWTLYDKHTPWYDKTVTILRQPQEKDWESVFSQLKEEIKNVK